jgi:peptide/nickel transport system substrate-binding protein
VNPPYVPSEVLRPGAYYGLLYVEIIDADPDPSPFWHSSQGDYPGLNSANFVNRKADALLEEARVATDEKVRAEKYRAFQEILKQEYPAVFLYAPTYTYAVSTEIKGIATSRILSPADRLNDIEGRYIKTKRVWK